MAADEEAGRRLLQRPNPVESRETRFARNWVSDGDVADVAAQEIARAQRKIARFLFGGDIEHAQARPSPQVRFNPARHERSADPAAKPAATPTRPRRSTTSRRRGSTVKRAGGSANRSPRWKPAMGIATARACSG
ncbi:hypothetical protein H1235_02255 [Pseudoxanthomonas sp. NC8]|nr:hypothetical protein H1235_02255 [Pseudoxanthomonas sp. NC8]